jgi:hypothetical protein
MPRTLRQLWADEDDAQERELERSNPSASKARRPAHQIGRRPWQEPREVAPNVRQHGCLRTLKPPGLGDLQGAHELHEQILAAL